LDTENWLDWYRDLDNSTDCKDNCEADNESDIDLDNAIDDTETPVEQNVSTASIVPGLLWPRWRSKQTEEKVLMTVNTIERRRNKGIKIK